MIPATNVISPDEKAWLLRERNLVRPPHFQLHRYQIVKVVRGDTLAEWWNDLGPASQFTGPELEIPGLLEETVGSLWDLADHYRLGEDYWQKRSAEIGAESSLITDWTNQVEERQRIIHNRSAFGPGVRKQRNGFSLAAARGWSR